MQGLLERMSSRQLQEWAVFYGVLGEEGIGLALGTAVEGRLASKRGA